MERGFRRGVASVFASGFCHPADRYGVRPERLHFVMGQPVSFIHDFIEQFLADVVVMGTIHREGLDRFIGSNTVRALYSVPGSELAVRQSQ